MRKQIFRNSDEYLIWAMEEIRRAKLSTDSVSLATALHELNSDMEKLVEIEQNLNVPVLEYASNLLSGVPLSPIEEEDTLEENGFWKDLGDNMFQNTRWSSLYKQIDEDGNFRYMDSARFEVINVDLGSRGKIVQNNFVTAFMNMLMPVLFPYNAPIKKAKVYIQAFNVNGHIDQNTVMSDTLGILYVEDPRGTLIEVKKFFKKNNVTKKMEEIPFVDYAFRRKKYEDNKEKLSKKGDNNG